MPGAEENVAWTALGEEHGDGCWTRVRFPPSPPFKGRGELIGLRESQRELMLALPALFAHCLAPVQGGGCLLLTARRFSVDLQYQPWYHWSCEASTARAKDSMEGTREWLSPKTQSLT